jgi:MFS family permease
MLKVSGEKAVLLAAGAGNFAVMTAFGIPVIVPTISADLGVDVNRAGLIVNAYFLVLTAVVLVVGRLGDLLGQSRVYLVGAVLLAASFLLAALARDFWQLVLARGVQGVAAAMVYTAALAAVGHAFGVGRRGRAVGILTMAGALGSLATTALASAVAPTLGWRTVFLLLTPLGLVGLAGLPALRRFDPGPLPHRLDLWGAFWLLLTFTFFALSLNHFHEGPETFVDGWTYHVPMHLATLACLGMFVWWERRVKAPLIDLGQFRNRRFSAAVVANGIVHSTMMGSSFLLPFLVERGFGLSTAQTGILLMTLSACNTVGGLLGGFILDRTRSPLLGPAGITALGLGLCALGLAAPLAPFLGLFPVVAFLGLAMGGYITVNNTTIIGAVAPDQRGFASGMEQVSRHLGHSVGVALAGAVMSLFVPAGNAGGPGYISGFQAAVVALGAVALVGAVFASAHAPRRRPGALEAPAAD